MNCNKLPSARMNSPAQSASVAGSGDATGSTLSTKVMSMRFMQRHQEKVRSAAVSGVATVKARADTATAPASDKPAASSTSTAPAKRVAPVLGRRSFGGFNPHIQAHCDRLIAASIKSSEPDIEQPRSSHHLVDDAEKHADVKADVVAAAMGFKKPRRSID